MSTSPASQFDPAVLARLDEPVRRYFTHAISEGAAVTGVRVTMAGRIKVARWLPFSAEEDCNGRSFAWRARVGWAPVTLLNVVDHYGNGAGGTDVRLFGRVALSHADDHNTARSAAGRAALESVWLTPTSLLSNGGVMWRAESNEVIVGRFELPPERPEVHVRIDDTGAVRTLSALRWGKAGQKTFDYIPCGCEVHAERRFGDLVIASSVTVGWWFGTPRYAPFFKAQITDLRPMP
jgi:hypothetical protein